MSEFTRFAITTLNVSFLEEKVRLCLQIQANFSPRLDWRRRQALEADVRLYERYFFLMLFNRCIYNKRYLK